MNLCSRECSNCLEGSEVEVPVGANSKNAMVPLTTVNTKNILFICGGAFPDLEDIIKKTTDQAGHPWDLAADLKDKYDDDKNIFAKVDDGRYPGIRHDTGVYRKICPLYFLWRAMDEDLLVKDAYTSQKMPL